MVERLSLLDALKTKGFDAAVVLTYNVFFPFYEQVVLRRLTAAGIRHHILLCDAGMLAAALAEPLLRPRLAGRLYTLVPAAAPGAFHPKMIMLLSKRHGVLFVGSHNLTISGFGRNRELTCVLDTREREDRAGFADAWSFLSTWAEQLESREVLGPALKICEGLAPWLRRPRPAGAMNFFGTNPESPALWEQVRPTLPDRVRRLVVAGPYYDHKLAFLHALRRDLTPDEMWLALDPESAVIPGTAAADLSGVHLVHAGGLGADKGAVGMLHAKLIWMEDEQGREHLIVGSANPSRPAWLGEPDSYNVEAVMVSHGETGQSFASDLGISLVFELPRLSDGDWQEMDARAEVQKTKDVGKAQGPLLAIETAAGFVVRLPIVSGIIEVVGLTADGPLPEAITSYRYDAGTLEVEVDARQRGQLRFLQVIAEGSTSFLAVVLHTSILQHKGQTDRQRELARMLVSLGKEIPDVEGLLKIADKMIFTSEIQLATDPDRGAPGVEKHGEDKGQETADSGDAPLPTLAGPPRVARLVSARRRVVKAGDIGLIIDVVNRTLSKGLESAPEEPLSPVEDEIDEGDGPEVSEEELVNSEDEEELPPEVAIDAEKVLTAGRRRLKTMCSRLAKQLKKARERGDDADATRVLVQVAAVLAIFYRVRALDVEANWKSVRKRLVPVELLASLFKAIWTGFLEGDARLFARMVEIFGAHGCEELSMVRGLLVWLALESGLSLKRPAISCPPKEHREAIANRCQLTRLVCEAAFDPDAASHARVAVAETARTGNEAVREAALLEKLEWGRTIFELGAALENAAALGRKAAPGDVAWVTSMSPPVPMMVTKVTGNVTLEHIVGYGPRRRYTADKVVVLAATD